MPKILLSNHYDEASYAILEQFIPEGFELHQLASLSQEELAEAIVDADYLIASGRLKINEEVLSKASHLKMVARTGVGLDSVDVDALRARDIPLYVSQGVNAQSVAEHTLLLMLAALRGLPAIDAKTKNGAWLKRAHGIQTHELSCCKVFIIGYGNIGKRVAKLLEPFGCDVSNSDCLEKGNLPKELCEADILTLHCALLPETAHLVDEEMLNRLKPGCVIINTARGGLIDEHALASALKDGRVGFACLDVREAEPAATAAPFDGLENVILTPHIGGITCEAFGDMMRRAMECVMLFAAGDLDAIEDRRVCL